MDLIFKNLCVLLVFATLVAFSWIHGGARADCLANVMPWLWALLFEAMLFFPQRRPHEDPLAARTRVWRSLRSDPILYVTFVLLVVLVIPFANRGLCEACDYPKIMAGASPDAPVPFAPFCVNVAEHFGVVLWFVPALTAMLAAKHALSRSGKRLLVEMIAWNGAALAVLGFVQRGTGATGVFWGDRPVSPDFFSVFGYPNMGGSFFTMMFAFSVGVWLQKASETADLPSIDKARGSASMETLNRFLKGHYALAAVVLNFFGAVCTLSRAAIMLTLGLAGLAFVYYEVSLIFASRHRARNVKTAAFAAVGALVFVVGVFVFSPDRLGSELGTLNANAVADRVSGKGEYSVRAAMSIFKDHPFFGVGGWGYRHFFRNYLSGDELRQVPSVGGANVHNDYMQFLCEHGAVGAGALLVVLILLLSPIFTDWYRLIKATRFLSSDKAPPMPRSLYCLPPGTFWVLMGNVALMIHAFGDCPMRSGACLSSFFVTLACAGGFVPRGIEDGR